MNGMNILLASVPIILATIAAFFWWHGSNVVIRDGDPKSTGSVFIRGIDVISTWREQGKWNSAAAIVTGFALFAQTISLLL